VIAAAKFGFDKDDLEDVLPRVGEVPFSSERKRMTTVHNLDEHVSASPEERKVLDLLHVKSGQYIAFTKGAPDTLLEVCTHVWVDDKVESLSPELLKRIDEANNRLAQEGLRVLGLGFRKWEVLPQTWTPEAVEKDIVFVGMVGIIDPPRAEVRDAVAICKEAGIRPVMITGDHPLTALNIARQLGIAQEGDRALTGYELTGMTQQELEAVVEKIPVYARVSPENKLDIVKALQTRGHVTAMTGDGVNDAPALKRADIGVAMGITGTAVSKEAADMVLTDDNFATIVSSVEEGRTIYENIRRFIKYLLASNTGELIVLLASQLIQGLSLPLTTLQILWMNLITDGVPALALGVERGEPGGMKRAPYPPTESIFGRGMGRHILIVGATMGLAGIALGYWAFRNFQSGTEGFQANTWKTMVFVFLTLAQMGHAIALRSHKETIFKMGLGGNRLLLGAVIFTVVVQISTVYLPFFNDPRVFGTVPLTAGQLALCLLLSTIVFWVVEFEKLLMRRGVLKS
jgi:P-type Ca2+ transporter type 2C